jgi:hypothetical protein
MYIIIDIIRRYKVRIENTNNSVPIPSQLGLRYEPKNHNALTNPLWGKYILKNIIYKTPTNR